MGIDGGNGVAPFKLPIKTDFFECAFLNFKEFGLDFDLSAGILVEAFKNALNQVQEAAFMGDNHLEAIKNELVATGLVERNPRLLKKAFDLGSNITSSTSSSATAAGGRKRISAATATASSGSACHALDSALGNLVELGFQAYRPPSSHSSLGDDNGVVANIKAPAHHFGNEADHLVQGHAVQRNGDVWGRLSRRIHHDDVSALLGGIGFSKVELLGKALEFRHNLR